MSEPPRRIVLVPLDGSQPAAGQLAIGEAVARLYDAEVHVLHVSAAAMTPAEVCDRVGLPEPRPAPERVRHRAGDAARAIVDEARALGAAAIAMSSHGETGDPSAVAGHVTLAVLAATPCPVVVTRAFLDAGSQAKRIRDVRCILVPLDGTKEAARACEEAIALAARQGAQVRMLHVIPRTGGRGRAGGFPRFADHAAYELEAWREEFARISLAGVAAREDVRSDVALRVGDPADEIVSFAESEDCDLVVVAWGGRMTPHRAVIVRKLLTAAPCPLMFLLADAKPGAGTA